MRDEILKSLDDPCRLEQLYRKDKSSFKQAFNSLYTDIEEDKSAQIWNARLNYAHESISWGTQKELIFVIIACILAGLIAKIPAFTTLDPDYFYSRNIAFVIFPLLTGYFAWKHGIDFKRIVSISVVFLISGIYINILPSTWSSDTLILACIHLPIFLWAILGYAFVGGRLKDIPPRLDYLRFNGDLVVMTTIILIAGGILAGITIGLFSLIDMHIDDFYLEYIGIWGLAASPIVGTYLIQTNPHLVNKVSPVIAKVFTPLVLITLIIYLSAVVYTGKDPYNDRDFLLIFNLLLIGVMAIILFSVAEGSSTNKKIGRLMLLGLSIVTILVNGIALSAILFRISAWGITPNRLAVLGSNVLIMCNLLIVSFHQFMALRNKHELELVETSIARFIPIYSLWAAFVVFVFPLVFGFR